MDGLPIVWQKTVDTKKAFDAKKRLWRVFKATYAYPKQFSESFLN